MQAGWRGCAEAHSVKLPGAGVPAEITILGTPKRGSFCAFGNFTRPFLRCLGFPFCSPPLSQRRAAPQPDLPSTGTRFWGASVLPANPRLASPGDASGLADKPQQVQRARLPAARGREEGGAALIYDKGFAIKEVFSEGTGGGRRPLSLPRTYSSRRFLQRLLAPRSTLGSPPHSPGPPPPAPSRVSLSRAGGAGG